jgi:hypothetical protein
MYGLSVCEGYDNLIHCIFGGRKEGGKMKTLCGCFGEESKRRNYPPTLSLIYYNTYVAYKCFYIP